MIPQLIPARKPMLPRDHRLGVMQRERKEHDLLIRLPRQRGQKLPNQGQRRGIPPPMLLDQFLGLLLELLQARTSR